VRRKSDTRERLLDAGQQKMHANGYNATGIQDITTAAGVPKGSFYNHFQTKEEFAAEVVERYFAAYTRTVLRVLGDEQLTPLARLRAYFVERTQWFAKLGFERGCMLGNFGLEIPDHSKLLRDRLSIHFVAWTKALTICVREGQKVGEIRTDLAAEDLAEFALNSWEGALLRMKVDKAARPMELFQSMLFDAFLTREPLLKQSSSTAQNKPDGKRNKSSDTGKFLVDSSVEA
jgi:TetR/AcrR family transcriptional repressor of nem operon